jgi:hypothetical protein
MNCSKCGNAIQASDKFCSSCGTPVANAQFCAGCGSQITVGASFCANCGKSLQGAAPATTAAQPKSQVPAGNKNIPAGESVIMDTGTFPVAYVKSVMSSINGKLSLTNNYLVFKAGHLQGIGGASIGGLFIPNPAEANKSKEHFSIPLASITAVEKGWSHITVTSEGQKYKFGGMTKTGEWEQAINNARG